ncbi:MAG: hypothetical protein ABEJ83_04740 [Candidatus Nanohaloarchaea archaeon]
MNNDRDLGQLEEEQLIFRHIDRINRAVTGDLEGLNEEASMDPNTWSHRISYAVKFLGSMLDPLISEEKSEEIEEEIKEYKEDEDDSSNPFMRVSIAQIRFRKYIEVLQENNMAFQESEEFVVENRSKNDGLLENNSSSVEEEIE